MAYCGPRGIELDAFLRWSPRSQDAALAWAAQEARRCPHCGTHPDDWSEDPQAHHAHLQQCKGCQRRQRLSSSTEAQEAGPGVTAVLATGPATACARCQPDDDD